MPKLPGSGPISLDMIRQTFGSDAPFDAINEYYRGQKFVPGVNTNIPASGQVRWSDYYGARTAEAGATEWGPGTYQVKIPDYAVEIGFELWGGGGGAWIGASAGTFGGATSIHSLNANGGASGGWMFEGYGTSVGGDGGGGSGGDINGVGEKGGMGYVFGRDPRAKNGKGEAYPANGVGGEPGFAVNAGNKWHIVGGGGGGGYTMKTWAYGDPSAPAPGSTLTLIVGAAGSGGVPTGGYAKMTFS